MQPDIWSKCSFSCIRWDRDLMLSFNIFWLKVHVPSQRWISGCSLMSNCIKKAVLGSTLGLMQTLPSLWAGRDCYQLLLYLLLYVCKLFTNEYCAIRLRSMYSEMSILTVFRLRAQWIVIQILETPLWFSFIVVSSAPEVSTALVVFEEGMNMRVCSGNF